jgi:hypothetical protein
VLTSVAARGIPVEDGVNALVRDDPRAFADEVVRLLRDETARRDVGGRALDLARAALSPTAVYAALDQALSDLR